MYCVSDSNAICLPLAFATVPHQVFLRCREDGSLNLLARLLKPIMAVIALHHTVCFTVLQPTAAEHLDIYYRAYLASDDGSTREGRHFSPCEALTEMSMHHRLFIASFAWTFPKAKRRRCCDGEQPTIFNARLPLGPGDRTLDGGMCGLEQPGDQVLCMCIDVVVQRVINDDISCIGLWCGSICEPVAIIVV